MIKRLMFGLAILMVGCEESMELEQPTVEQRVFSGYLEEAESRTYINDLIQLRWTANDLITIFEGTTRNKKYIFLGETGDNAGEFDYLSQGFGTGNDLPCYYAVYPYSSATKITEEGVITYTFPAEQSYAEQSFGIGANPMVAVTADLDDMDLGFRNVGSYLRMRLYGNEQTVGSIVVTALGGEPLSGKASVVPVYGGEPACTMLGTTNTVTLSCGEGVGIGTTESEATDFWIVLPYGTYANGISVQVNGFYGGSQTFTVANSLTLNRNKFKTMTRELTISQNNTNMGVNDWDKDGEGYSGSAE